MRKIAILVLFVLCGRLQAELSPRIIGGEPIDPGTGEYFVTLLYAFNWDTRRFNLDPPEHDRFSWNPVCGGAYIGNGKILTAAHCLENLPSSGNLHVLIGDKSDDMAYEKCVEDLNNVLTCFGVSEPPDQQKYYLFYESVTSDTDLKPIPVQNIKIHPFYDEDANLSPYDIALLEIPEVDSKGVPISWPSTSIAIPTSDQFAALASSGAANNVRSIGHGDTLSDNSSFTFEPSAQLQQVDLTAASDAVCVSAFGSVYNKSNMICAGDPGEDSCQGDSGGPLIDPTTQLLLGIVSFGPSPCGDQKESYGVYTDVFAFRNWISSGGVRVDGMAEIAEDGTVYRMGNVDSSITIGAFGWVTWFAGLLLLFGRRR